MAVHLHGGAGLVAVRASYPAPRRDAAGEVEHRVQRGTPPVITRRGRVEAGDGVDRDGVPRSRVGIDYEENYPADDEQEEHYQQNRQAVIAMVATRQATARRAVCCVRFHLRASSLMITTRRRFGWILISVTLSYKKKNKFVNRTSQYCSINFD